MIFLDFPTSPGGSEKATELNLTLRIGINSKFHVRSPRAIRSIQITVEGHPRGVVPGRRGAHGLKARLQEGPRDALQIDPPQEADGRPHAARGLTNGELTDADFRWNHARPR